ncbi:MAG: WYL domain-containing protein [Clostridia bacterium]|nr:WYL domain-containing protein [Clostridia bacterium]
MKTPSKQKLRLLYIIDILSKKSDEEHPMSATQIMDYLREDYGIDCERKTVYDCIECLNEYGYEIIKSQSPRGYFMTPYYFEPAELRLLIDAVQSADFISAKKSKSLVKKFSSFASEYQYKRIEKQVYIDNRNKCANENLFILIDIISSAILARKQIEVFYRRRKIVDGKTARYEEKSMTINPYALIWADDHYYLVGNYSKYDNLIHLRIDRLKSVKVLDTYSRHFSEVSPYQTSFDIADYSNKHLSMFSGDIKPVEMICNNTMIEDFVDQFGEKVSMKPYDDENFIAKVDVAVTDGLVAWIMQYGNKIKVKSPKELKNMIIDKTNSILALYNG